MGMVIDDIDPDTGNVSLSNPENGQLYTIDHGAETVTATEADGSTAADSPFTYDL